MTSHRILIVDDHQLAREGLRAVLASSELEVVGMAENGEQAIELARELQPDVILMDLRLGKGIDGLEATRAITALGLKSKVLMLTLHDMPAYVREVMTAGAAGYLLKDSSIGELCAAIETVMAGRSALPLHLVSAALADHSPVQDSKGLVRSLTSRERTVVDLIADGLTNKEIARRLEISPATVKVHVERIIGKLGVADRTQAAVLIARIGSTAS